MIDEELDNLKKLTEILGAAIDAKTLTVDSFIDVRDAVALEAVVLAGILERVQKIERILERQFPGAKYIK